MKIFVFASVLLCFSSALKDQSGLICFDILRQDAVLTLCCELDAMRCMKFQRNDLGRVFMVDVEQKLPGLC